MSTNIVKNKARIRGQFSSKKDFEKRQKFIDATKARYALDASNKSMEVQPDVVVNSVVTGRRVVEVIELGKNLKCFNCHSILSLLNIEKERRCGLHSVFTVKCQNCQTNTEVPTGKTHKSEKNYPVADVNSKAVIGKLLSY